MTGQDVCSHNKAGDCLWVGESKWVSKLCKEVTVGYRYCSAMGLIPVAPTLWYQDKTA